MPTYKIGLAQIYLITIEAEDLESAKRLSEMFVGDSDLSASTDRQEGQFAIERIELLENDIFECDDV